ncbi:SCO2400 family protein [Streptomyces tanashiensis]|uniref:SCO2400 family protein n=1 Tax=Streptomyces tanashiensis TaxID=67367 RepID=UPI003F4D4DCF
MDYCHACRRHLNGALACAGCGTPVEALRYETPHIPVHTPDHGYGYGEPTRPAIHDERFASQAIHDVAVPGTPPRQVRPAHILTATAPR